jgi:hypothetical protein
MLHALPAGTWVEWVGAVGAGPWLRVKLRANVPRQRGSSPVPDPFWSKLPTYTLRGASALLCDRGDSVET